MIFQALLSVYITLKLFCLQLTMIFQALLSVYITLKPFCLQLSMIFHSIEVKIVLRRLAGYYVINVVIPMILLSSLGNIVFLVSAESGDKLTVALTLLLSQV